MQNGNGTRSYVHWLRPERNESGRGSRIMSSSTRRSARGW